VREVVKVVVGNQFVFVELGGVGLGGLQLVMIIEIITSRIKMLRTVLDALFRIVFCPHAHDK
jgi:hypothetical protein